jgi:hypothetical protein
MLLMKKSVKSHREPGAECVRVRLPARAVAARVTAQRLAQIAATSRRWAR